ncbi:MAG: ATP-binding protein, partial [Rhodothermales bacterium]
EANRWGVELLGCNGSDIVGRPLSDFVSVNDTWKFLKHLRTASRSGHRESTLLRLRRADETTFLAHLVALAQTDSRGATTGFHVAATTADAQLIEAKEEAEEMTRLKSAFLANMSHEIRTPLTGIIGFATVLSKELPLEQREFAELIRESGRRLMEMLNSVLDLAKLESDQMLLQSCAIDLSMETRRATDLLRSLAQEKGLTLECLTGQDADRVMVAADRAALNRVLHNLIGNAIKFTEDGGVRVQIWSADDRCYLAVSDTGVGIDDQFLPLVFDEFRQESSGTMRSHQGTGLGLAITRRLVDLMCGHISVESEKGKGSTFTVSLPIAEAQPEARTNGESVFDHEAPPVSLLLVEDDGDTQHLLMELLEPHYNVAVAGSAADAFLKATEQHFDLIMMDIDLGEGPDGVELLHQVRSLPPYESTPIIAVTAFALPGDRERFLDMGFTAYVSKPFDVDELIQLPLQFS